MCTDRIYINNILKHIPGSIYWKDRNGVYLGCNQMEAEMVGLESPEAIIGKTDSELPWSSIADVLRATDQRIMQTEIPEEVLENPTLADGTSIFMITKKSPLYDDDGNVIGIIGVSIDITDRRKAEALQIKNKEQEIRIGEQKEFGTFTAQVLHDIVSPLSSLEFIIKSPGIPEKYYLTLKDITGSINEIVSALKEKYIEYEKKSSNSSGYILVPLMLEDIIRNKEYEYKDTNIVFNYSYDLDQKFTFIDGDRMSFSRMISNLVNNAVEACDKDLGKVDISFKSEDNHVIIAVTDNGIGIPKDIIDKIKFCSQNVCSTKHTGTGLGLGQILMTIESYGGTWDIKSRENAGTTFLINFPKVDCPKWISKQLTLKKNDVVVVLDDDPSIYSIFEEILKKYFPDLTLKFFKKSKEALDFVDSFNEKERIFFLSDFELRGSDFNGMMMILQSGIKRERSCLFTSIHGDKNLHDMAERSNIKVLLKQFLRTTIITVEE